MLTWVQKIASCYWPVLFWDALARSQLCPVSTTLDSKHRAFCGNSPTPLQG